jgi:hypothetical protein
MRGFISVSLLILFPILLFAADSNAAMLYTHGAAWINGTHVPSSSSAIFSGDLLQTRSDSVANINQPGTTITVQSDSLVKFENTLVQIEHGGVTVSTSKGVATSAGGIKVSPVSNAWSEFSVVDADGTVRIAARKGDVNIDDGHEVVTLAQGQETTRDETPQTDKEGKKKGKKRGTGAVPAAGGGLLNSPVAIAVGGAAVVGVVGIWWVATKNDEPASPAKP